MGDWNKEGLREGQGHLRFPDGTRYDGNFEANVFCGLGVLTFPDGAKLVFIEDFVYCLLFCLFRYEGEFLDGWFHGYGVFWRADGMRHEGEFRGGKIWGLGTFQKISQTASCSFRSLQVLQLLTMASMGFPATKGFSRTASFCARKDALMWCSAPKRLHSWPKRNLIEFVIK